MQDHSAWDGQIERVTIISRGQARGIYSNRRDAGIDVNAQDPGAYIIDYVDGVR
jgi:hypothetical protein